MELSVVIPAYNEARRLPATVAAVTGWLAARHPDSELVIVDDGSTDDTRRVLAALVEARSPRVDVEARSPRVDVEARSPRVDVEARSPRVDVEARSPRVDVKARAPRLRVEAFERNRGKGAAVRHGVLCARGARIAFLDADLAYGLEPLDALLGALDAGADLAVGARDLLPDENRAGYRPVRRLATAAFNGLVSAVLGLTARDTQCGLKAFRRAAARGLFSAVQTERFGFDVEVLFLAERWGLETARVPVRMRAHAESSVDLLSDSANMLADLLRIRARARRGAYPSGLPDA